MSRRIPLLASILLTALLASGCGLLGFSTRLDTEAEIKATIDALATAGAAKDEATIKKYLSATILTQALSGEAIEAASEESKEEIIARLREIWENVRANTIDVTVANVDVRGDEAVADGAFTLHLIDNAGNAARCAGAGEAAFSRSGDAWTVSSVRVEHYTCDVDQSTIAAAGSADPSGGGGVMSLLAVGQASFAADGTPKVAYPRCEYLVLGLEGEQVRTLQRTLSFLGYNPGVVDGSFGPNTDRAVRAFQSDHDLYVDGEVGPKTYAELRKAVARKGGSYECASTATAAYAGPTTLTKRALRAGTPYETAVYIYQSPVPGPTLVFVGCIHGNEHSGHVALTDAIERGITISRGRVVIVPSYNKLACEDDRRTLSYPGSAYNGKDFNRMFPVGSTPTYLIARELWNLITSQPNLAFVVDFHDGFVNSLANTLLHTRQAKAQSIARTLRDHLNDLRPSGARGPSFDAYPEPISGSLIRKVGRDLGVPGILAELAGRQVGDPESLRKKYVRHIMRLLAYEHDMAIAF